MTPEEKAEAVLGALQDWTACWLCGKYLEPPSSNFCDQCARLYVRCRRCGISASILNADVWGTVRTSDPMCRNCHIADNLRNLGLRRERLYRTRQKADDTRRKG